MGKSFLIINTPNYCTECPLSDEAYGRKVWCKEVQVYIEKWCERPDWCPLRPIPVGLKYYEGYDNDYSYGYTEGYNTCLETFLGDDVYDHN